MPCIYVYPGHKHMFVSRITIVESFSSPGVSLSRQWLRMIVSPDELTCSVRRRDSFEIVNRMIKDLGCHVYMFGSNG